MTFLLFCEMSRGMRGARTQHMLNFLITFELFNGNECSWALNGALVTLYYEKLSNNSYCTYFGKYSQFLSTLRTK